MGEFAVEVKIWWAIMSAIGVLNIGLWLYTYRLIQNMKSTEGAEIAPYRKWQWIMSGMFVLGCASRSFVLRGDVARITVVDHWFASVMVGRTIATIAEVAFVVQWALLALLLARRQESKPVALLGWSIVPLICIAEVFSWWASLTTNHLGNALEESLWAFSAMLMIVVLSLSFKAASTELKRFLKAGLVLAVAYVIFMVTVDVPTYVSRWQEATAANKTFLTVSEGLVDIQRYTVTGSYDEWKYNMVWMTLYFSLAVWISLAMVILPRFEQKSS